MAKLSIVQLKSVVHNYVNSNKISVDSFSETRDNSVGLLDTALFAMFSTSFGFTFA